jgi:mannose-1-phosphate guanylyltransferase/mannose-6-phosphate isomerase
MNQIIPVVLCGGSGTRLWPLSRAGFPKQFLVLSGNSSLFQQACRRVNSLSANDIEVRDTLVVTNEEHRFIALDQLRELEPIAASLLLEPVGKNTAAALTLAALEAARSCEDPTLVVVPADQTVEDEATFIQALQTAVRTAADGSLVILGITPDRPETGYGYIRRDSAAGEGVHGEFIVSQFAEKPDRERAVAFLATGEYAWNSGIFVVKASTWLNALAHFRPDIETATRAAWEARTVDVPFVRPDKQKFCAIPSESIDFAVAERCPGSKVAIKVVPLKAGWSDLGAWDAVWAASDKDDAGNVTYGDVLLENAVDTFVHTTSRLVCAVGVRNLVVVETPDAVLVADKADSQNVKKIVSAMNLSARNELALHRKVHRPWGWYDSIDESDRFKVKRIQVKPGASLSLQKHHHRAEHWIVVRGTGQVTCGDKTILLTENQSTYIPLGAVHRLANPGTIPLEIIEVQSGSYLGEDDIVRFEDTYGRSDA